MRGDSASYALVMLIQRVSPPVGGRICAWVMVTMGGLGKKLSSWCHIGAVTQLGINRRDLLIAGTQIGIESVHLRLAKMAGNGQMLRWRHIWHMQHQRFMLDQRSFQFLQGLGGQLACQISFST